MSFLVVLEATMRGADALPRQIAGGLRRTKIYRRFRAAGARTLYAIFMLRGGPFAAHDGLLENEAGMRSCLESKSKVAGGRRRQEEASPCPREYRHRSEQARSLRSG